ncbi:MAG: MoaD/ThiS family protein [Candidatus Dormibacteria bacterium]
MIRVVLPTPLRVLARVKSEIHLEVQGAITLSAVLDCLESQYPSLLGTMRDQVTHKRRPFIRFYAGEEDLSHEPTDLPLPDPIATGAEPLWVVGAMAGG